MGIYYTAISQIIACSSSDLDCRDVDELAEMLGPMLAPFISKAVNLASAAYMARTLARPAIPASTFATASQQPWRSALSVRSYTVERRGGTASARSSEAELPMLRRSATASWVLSEG